MPRRHALAAALPFAPLLAACLVYTQAPVPPPPAPPPPEPPRDLARASAEQQERLQQENSARRRQRMQRYCDPVGPHGCPRGAWSKLEETEAIGPNGLRQVRAVCVPFEPPVARPCTDEEKQQRREAALRVRQKAIDAMKHARGVCASHRCPGRQTPTVRFVCLQGPGDRGEGRRVHAEPTCTMLAKMRDDPLYTCHGELVVEKVCGPPPQPPGVCKVGPNECCMPDGRVVRPCGHITAPGSDCNATATCGGGGWCNPCMCLPPEARITTPTGTVPVSGLHEGDAVVVVDTSGRRRSARVVRVKRTPVLGSHQMVVAELADGRAVTASGPHPLADGRALSSLAAGDRVDGARVVRVARLPYWSDATWDLLTDVPGSAYFADGVPLRSTLEPAAAPAAVRP